MKTTPAGPVTRLVQAAGAGDAQAAADLLPLVYDELRKLAKARMAKTPPGNTLQPTALVHEAYLRLVGDEAAPWNSRGHFFGAAAEAMRQILVDQARRKLSRKHGGRHRRVELGDVEVAFEFDGPPEMLELDRALTDLQHTDERKARVVLLRYFAGLTNVETAAVLDVSVPTVERDWRFARAFLLTMLSTSNPSEESNISNGSGEAQES